MTERIVLHLPDDLVASVERIGAGIGRTRSWVVVRALKIYLEHEGADVIAILNGREEAARGGGHAIENVLDELQAIVDGNNIHASVKDRVLGILRPHGGRFIPEYSAALGDLRMGGILSGYFEVPEGTRDGVDAAIDSICREFGLLNGVLSTKDLPAARVNSIADRNGFWR